MSNFETIFKCKIDQKRFFGESEAIEHLKIKHLDSYQVQKVEAEKVESPKTEPKKRGRPKKLKVEDIITSTFRKNFPTAQAEPVQA
ncbi:MAG: hypothetical protein ACYC9U_09450 [Nitrososphaerales archaeon]